MSRYGCHNRKPFKHSFIARGGYVESRTSSLPGPRLIPIFIEVPFRMSPECNYTHTDLGQADDKCVGCKHRKEA